MLQSTTVLNERCSPRVIFRWKNDFQEDQMKLPSKTDSELWKFLIFHSSDSKTLTRYQKILWICSFRYENLLNFAWHSMKFHNCHHVIYGGVITFNICLLKLYVTFMHEVCNDLIFCSVTTNNW